jgi:hypothetical protein
MEGFNRTNKFLSSDHSLIVFNVETADDITLVIIKVKPES